MKFKGHGEYSISFDGTYIQVYGRGPWNREAVLEYVTDIKTAHLETQQQCKGVLLQLHGVSLFTLDSMEDMKALHAWRMQQGIRYPIAYVILDEETRDISALWLDKMSKTNSASIAFFDNAEDAKIWLAASRNHE